MLGSTPPCPEHIHLLSLDQNAAPPSQHLTRLLPNSPTSMPHRFWTGHRFLWPLPRTPGRRPRRTPPGGGWRSQSPGPERLQHLREQRRGRCERRRRRSGDSSSGAFQPCRDRTGLTGRQGHRLTIYSHQLPLFGPRLKIPPSPTRTL